MAGLIGRVDLMMNLVKNTGLAHSAWNISSKMDWRVRLGSIDQSGGPDGERAVRAD